MEITNLQKAIDSFTTAITELYKEKKHVIIAIDGPSGAGKSTFAEHLSILFKGNIIHVDDFFLQLHQRTQERLDTPGGNFDRERLLKEVILPAKNKSDFSYRPYDCKKGELLTPVNIQDKPITFIEGVYSCHPELWDYYDYRIFIKIDKETQLKRLEERNPKLLERFISEWIPLEDKYFSTFNIPNKCDLIVEI